MEHDKAVRRDKYILGKKKVKRKGKVINKRSIWEKKPEEESL